MPGLEAKSLRNPDETRAFEKVKKAVQQRVAAMAHPQAHAMH